MPTKGSKGEDETVYKAMRDMRDGVEFPSTRINPVGPNHYAAGSIGGGSDTRGTVIKGAGTEGPAEARGGK